MARRTSLLRCLVAYPLLGLSGVLLAQEIPGGVPPGATLDDSSETTPITIFGAKLVSWYRADLGVTGSAPVTAWADQSGNGHNLTASGTPALVTDGGDSAIDFEASDPDMFSRTITGEPVDEPIAVYVVASLESTAIQGVVALCTAGTTNGRWALDVATGPVFRSVTVATAGGSSTATHGASPATSTRYLFYVDWESSTDRSINIDGLGEVTETTSRVVGTPDRVVVGANHAEGTATEFDGLMFEVVILNAKPSGAEDTAYKAYADALFDIPGITSTPPLGPSDPYRWPLVLLAAGLAVLVASLRRRPQQREGRLLRLQPEAAARKAA